jgi:flagella basal body P-ring formation protein FlgA
MGRTDAPAEDAMRNAQELPTPTTSPTFRRIVALALALVMGCVSAARGRDTVTLRATAEVGEGKVLLRDVAELSGKAAEALGEVVVLEKWPAGETAWTTVEVGAVRSAMNATPNVNWGRISLSGSSCTVRKAVKPVGEAAGSVPTGAQAAEPTAAVATGGPSVRSMIPARLSEVFSVPESMMRLTFEDSAKALLDAPTGGRVVEITPNGIADRVPLTIRVFEKDRIVASGTTRVIVQVKRDVLLAKAALKRGHLLTLADAAIEARWVGPTVTAADTTDFGAVVKASLVKQGQMLLKSDLEPAVVVKRGEFVSVSCVSGTVIVKVTARAASDARVGEIIRFEGTDKKKQVFLARVAGPGKAVSVAVGGDEVAAAETNTATSGGTP